MKAIRIAVIILMILLLSVLVPSGVAIGEVLPLPVDKSPGPEVPPEGYLSDTEYMDESLHVNITQGRVYDTYWMAVTVKIADPSQLRTAVASSYRNPGAAYGSSIAKRVNAVLAINGDYYGYNTSGFCIRQGTVIRRRADKKSDVLIIDRDGNLHILPSATEEECEAYEDIAVNAFNFGPGLVIDGEMVTEFTDGQLNGKGSKKQAQRICLAQTGPLEYLIVYSEGPENKDSKGLTIAQFAELVYSFGNI